MRLGTFLGFSSGLGFPCWPLRNLGYVGDIGGNGTMMVRRRETQRPNWWTLTKMGMEIQN
jgi:hypothetical protein